MGDTCSVRAAGGLLRYLLQMKIINELDDEAAAIVLEGGLRTFSLSEFLHMDAVTMIALNIFANQMHPCVVKSSGKSKEGFSLCALLDRTSSPAGKKLLRLWCKQPSLSIETIRQRHDVVEFFMTVRSRIPELWHELKLLLKVCADCYVSRPLILVAQLKAFAEASGCTKTDGTH
jgi:DNA mismatch repair ATPase MutS